MSQDIEVQEIPIQDRPEAVIHLTDDTVFIDQQEYQIKINHKQALNKESLLDRYTKLLQKYDYIVGDWAHEKLRLKGFYRDSNSSATDDQKISALDDYLHEYCAFGCAYFVLELNGEPIPYQDEKAAKDTHNRQRRPYFDKKRSQAHAKKKENQASVVKKGHEKKKGDHKNHSKSHLEKTRPKRHRFTIKTKGE